MTRMQNVVLEAEIDQELSEFITDRRAESRERDERIKRVQMR